MNGDSQADTLPDSRALPSPIAPPRPVVVDIGGRTHPGKVRTNNEDNFHVVQFGRYLQALLSSIPAGQFPEELDRPGYGFVVADGMGGHKAGEIASVQAITLLTEYVLQTPDWIFAQETAQFSTVMQRAEARFQAVNEAILDQARNKPGMRGMGTTLTVALTLGDDLIVAHVGDSPAYLCRDGKLYRLTTDHTVAEQNRAFDANADRFRHVLTRVIGIPDAGGGPDIERYRLADGDRLLLCTDGLTDMADDTSIARELTKAVSADEACQALVDLALAGGGKDNVTAVVAEFRFPAAT